MFKIFVSYSRADFEPGPEGTESRLSLLLEYIKQKLGLNGHCPRYQILKDDEGLIRSSHIIKEKLSEAINECDFALVMLSDNYCRSPNCKDEFDALWEAQKTLIIIESEDVWDPRLKHPLMRYKDQVPKMHYEKFWAEIKGKKKQYGDPTPMSAPPPLKDKFFEALNNVCNDIAKLALELDNTQGQSLPFEGGKQDVFLACPTLDVIPYADRLERTLTDAGHSVLRFDTQYMDLDQDPSSDRSVASALNRAIARCDICIQLLGREPGDPIRGYDSLTLVPYQYELSKKQGKEPYLWREPGFDISELDDSYANFLSGVMFHRSSFDEFEDYVKDRLEAFLFRKEAEQTRADRLNLDGTQSSRPYVAVDAAKSDAPLARVITKALGAHVNVSQLVGPITNAKLKKTVNTDDAIVLVYGESDEGQRRIQSHFGIIHRHKHCLERKRFELAVGDGAPQTAPPPPGGPDVHVIPVTGDIDHSALAPFLTQLLANQKSRHLSS